MPDPVIVTVTQQGPPGPPYGQPLTLLQWILNPALPAPAVGQMYWDAANFCPATVLDLNGPVIIQHGQESLVRCVNKTGVTITNDSVVYLSGASGNRPTIALAKADNAATAQILGVATQDIANNAEGFVTVMGVVNQFNTSGFLAGDELYLSPTVAGTLTNVPPTSPNMLTLVATALNSTVNGSIFVHPQPPIDTDATFAAAVNYLPPSQTAVKTYLQNTYLPLITSLPIFANNAAAIAGGLTVGKFYRTGGDPDLVAVVH